MVSKSEQKKKRTNFPGSRIKKIMLTNEDIGKISPATPIVLGRALDQFLCEIISESEKIVKGSGSNKITDNEIDEVINTHKKYAFLRKSEQE